MKTRENRAAAHLPTGAIRNVCVALRARGGFGSETKRVDETRVVPLLVRSCAQRDDWIRALAEPLGSPSEREQLALALSEEIVSHETSRTRQCLR